MSENTEWGPWVEFYNSGKTPPVGALVQIKAAKNHVNGEIVHHVAKCVEIVQDGQFRVDPVFPEYATAYIGLEWRQRKGDGVKIIEELMENLPKMEDVVLEVN